MELHPRQARRAHGPPRSACRNAADPDRRLTATELPASGYLAELKHAGFVPRALESALEKRAACRNEPVRNYMNTERVAAGADFSDAQVAETFLHHRVLIVPVVDRGHVTGVITRADFFRAVAERFIAAP